jgi:hypothetical protein
MKHGVAIWGTVGVSAAWGAIGGHLTGGVAGGLAGGSAFNDVTGTIIGVDIEIWTNNALVPLFVD